MSSTLLVPGDKPAAVYANQIFGITLKDNGVGTAVYVDFLREALAAGIFVPAPAPLVVGTGLAALSEALAKQKAGVSASKVVVLL